MQTKFLTTEWKADDDGVVEGYGAIYGNVDRGGDVIAKGAFAESLASGRKVKMLSQHDTWSVIGVWDSLVEDDKGLRVKGRILKSVQAGREAYELAKAGALDGLSIGYRTVKASNAGGSRVIEAAELWEVSLVTFPMNEMARIDAVKAAAESAAAEFSRPNVAEMKRYVEGFLREAGFSNVEAKAGASALASKIGDLREAGPGLDELAALLKRRCDLGAGKE